MTGRDGYELDMSSPVSHVAAEMERAGLDGPALTVKVMAATYRHPLSSDIVRIRREENLGSDEEAVLWLIRAAIGELGRQVTRGGDGYRLAKPFSELKWKRHPVRRPGGDDHARLGDPFNPMTGGIFSGNVRIGKHHKSRPPEDDDLRESMRQNGWLPGHPAIQDERGVTITGHRRLRIAEELGNIEPDIQRVSFGSGDAADIARLSTAWFSNEGVKEYTKEDRKAVAAYLAERGWTQASIAEALHVATSTINRDLADRPDLISHVENQDGHHGGARRGAGRPRKADKAELHRDIADRMDHDEDIRREELAAKHGVGKNTVTRAVERERGRRDAPAPGSRERALQDILKILMGMSPDDRVWLLGQLPAMTP